jgi:hypothetical protein
MPEPKAKAKSLNQSPARGFDLGQMVKGSAQEVFLLSEHQYTLGCQDSRYFQRFDC